MPIQNGWTELLRRAQKSRSQTSKEFKLNTEKLDKVRTHFLTKRILYEDMKAPFDYVDRLYPEANVKQAMVYKVSKPYLHEVGYRGCGGFYDIAHKIICVTDWVEPISHSPGDFNVQAEFTIDEVLCHELIHYGANYNLPSASRTVEEEIAYGNSIKYLRGKGRSNEFIIKKNMMPYLISVVKRPEVYQKILLQNYSESALAKASYTSLEVMVKKEIKAVNEEILDRAYTIGLRLVEIYGDGKEDVYKDMSGTPDLLIDGDL